MVGRLNIQRMRLAQQRRTAVQQLGEPELRRLVERLCQKYSSLPQNLEEAIEREIKQEIGAVLNDTQGMR